MIQVDDYSTPTGLRVRMYSEATGIAIQMPADEFHDLIARAKAGDFDGLGVEPHEPFIHWPEKS